MTTASSAALFRDGGEEELHDRRGEDNRAYVATVEDAAARRAHLALAAHELAPHFGDGRDDRRGVAHRLAANLLGHVATVEYDAQRFGVAFESYRGAARDLSHRPGVRRFDARRGD